ncbi:MAG: DUF1820 family protein [Acidobacteriota bacterium]
MSDPRLYKIIFVSQGQVYELYARQVSQGGLFGFIEVEELVFGERSKVVVDPSEERLKKEFEGVKRFYLPMHAVLRIDEVEKEGAGRISEVEVDGKGEKSNIANFPMPIYTPTPSDS